MKDSKKALCFPMTRNFWKVGALKDVLSEQ